MKKKKLIEHKTEPYVAVQVSLRGTDNQLRTIWVDKHNKLKTGVTIELKDDTTGKRWRVEKIYDTEQTFTEPLDLQDILVCY